MKIKICRRKSDIERIWQRKMIENTYLEQYITRAHILPRNVPDWLMESLKKLKDPKNERQIKKIHEFIDYVENKRGETTPVSEG